MGAVPDLLEGSMTPVGVERVYGMDGSHGSCASYALPHGLADVQAVLERELDSAWARSGEKSSWRRAHAGQGASMVEVIHLYDPETVSVPGLDRSRVPPGTGTVLVLTEMYRPAQARLPGLFRRLVRRGTSG